jgi:hypothetical protein
MPIPPVVDDTVCPFDYAVALPERLGPDESEDRCIDRTGFPDEPTIPDTERPGFDWQAAYEAELQAERG